MGQLPNFNTENEDLRYTTPNYYLHISKQQTTQSMFKFIFLYFNQTCRKLENDQLNIQNKDITGFFRYHISYNQ